MSKLLNSDLSRTIVSVAGALMLSTTLIIAAVGPARAAVPQPAAATTAPAPVAF